ncbi:hypothetical protein SUGI_1007210 [Cryptomeria japonica]|nr:hypothetical protein SUGI_1007210 [Cryptomeria japonica]
MTPSGYLRCWCFVRDLGITYGYPRCRCWERLRLAISNAGKESIWVSPSFRQQKPYRAPQLLLLITPNGTLDCTQLSNYYSDSKIRSGIGYAHHSFWKPSNSNTAYFHSLNRDGRCVKSPQKLFA